MEFIVPTLGEAVARPQPLRESSQPDVVPRGGVPRGGGCRAGPGARWRRAREAGRANSASLQRLPRAFQEPSKSLPRVFQFLSKSLPQTFPELSPSLRKTGAALWRRAAQRGSARRVAVASVPLELKVPAEESTRHLRRDLRGAVWGRVAVGPRGWFCGGGVGRDHTAASHLLVSVLGVVCARGWSGRCYARRRASLSP